MRDLPPVEEKVDRPDALSQTFLSHVHDCARSGFLYIKEGGGPTSHRMDGGTALHEAIKRFIELLIDQEEGTGPSDVAKDVLASVIADHPELQLTHEELDALRVMMHHIAEGLLVEPDKIVAVEKMLELELEDGHRIRGKVDFAAIYGNEAIIRDWKSSYHLPSQSEFERSWQTRFYALLMAEGKGESDPVPIGKGLDSFTVSQVYPRYKGLPERKVTLTRQELHDFRQDVEAVVARAELGFGASLWPAVPGDHCSRCPAAYLCPLPAEMIPAPAGEPFDILEVAEREHWLTSEAKTLRTKIKAWAKETGEPIPVGTDLEWGFKLIESEKVKDLQAVKGLIEHHGLDLEDYITKSRSSRFEKRKVA